MPSVCVCVSSRLPFRERARCSLRKRQTQRQKLVPFARLPVTTTLPTPPPASATRDVKAGREEAGGQALFATVSRLQLFGRKFQRLSERHASRPLSAEPRAQAAARREGGGWRVAQAAGSRGLEGDRGEEPPAGTGRGEGTPKESPLGSPRPIQARLVLLSLVIPLVPRGPAGWVTLHRQELGPWCGRPGQRIPRAGALALKCARSGLWQFLLSLLSGYFCNPQSLIGPVSSRKPQNLKVPARRAPSFQAPPRPARSPGSRR